MRTPAPIVTLADAWAASRKAGNNFDLLRLVAAAAVIFSHSFEITKGPGSFEPLTYLTGGQAGFGRTAVLIFFILSGYLLAYSWKADANFIRFVWKRILRLAPGLVFVVVFLTFVVGPIISSYSLTDYFGSPRTWSFPIYFGPVDPYEGLPGVFEGLPAEGEVDKPLWTLKYEVLCYATLAVLGGLGLFRGWVCALVLIAAYGISFISPFVGEGEAISMLDQYADFARAFFAGALFALLGAYIRFDGKLALLCLAFLVFGGAFGLYNELFPLLAGYAVLWLALTPKISTGGAVKFGDLSYGIYVWGWPVQQMVEQYLGTGDWFWNFALALPITAACAAVSWQYVEAPALRLKKKQPTFSVFKALFVRKSSV